MKDPTGLNEARLDRRDFVKLGSASIAFLGLSGCGQRQNLEATIRPELRSPHGVDDRAWAVVRAQFLIDEKKAYLNNASLGMPPAQVVEAVADGYRAISEEPLHGKHDLQELIAKQVKPSLAQLFGAQVDEITLTRNASEALHLQTIGLDLLPGDEVLITTQEHPAGRRPWLFRAQRDGIQVKEVFVPSPLPSADEVQTLLEKAISRKTRAIAFCHITRGGHLYPVTALCQMARNRGLVSLVDGAQAVGQFSINLTELGCDAYSASLHKWMLGPTGTGFLYIRSEAREHIKTAFAPDATPDSPKFTPPGTADFPVRAALAAAIGFIETLGLDKIEGRCRHLSDYLKQRLSDVPGVTLLSSATSQSAPGSTIFEKTGLDAVEAVPMMERLASAHIDEHQRDGHNAIRVSTHVYNTRAEIDRLIAALAKT